MNREAQTQVRQLSERLIGDLQSYANPDFPDVIATLEVARQLSLLTEQVIRLNKKMDHAFGLGPGDR